MGIVACGGGGGTRSADYSGLYYVAVGPDPIFTLTLLQAGNDATFDLQGADMPISGTGAVSGSDLTLDADIPGFGTFTAQLTFNGAGDAFQGTWEVPEAPVSGTLTGTLQPWPAYDVNQLGIPQLATADAVDLARIARLSKFRSGAGHDYSDEFESCRSMKHYVHPMDGVDMSTIRIYAPCAGTVVGTTEEWDGPLLWKGTAVGIRPDGFDAFHVVLFHVHLDQPLAVGDHVSAGQQLGTSEKISGTASDIAFGVHTPNGFRLISYFEVMTAVVFNAYALRGVSSRADAIITAAQRDTDPLLCNGEEFLGPGALENWVILN